MNYQGGFITTDTHVDDNENMSLYPDMAIPKEIGLDMYAFAKDMAKGFEPNSQMYKIMESMAIASYSAAYNEIFHTDLESFGKTLTTEELKSVLRISTCIQIEKYCEDRIDIPTQRSATV